jgi:broad specificity phosphatase PhoE
MHKERRLFLIRHGETSKNKEKIVQGSSYPGAPLNNFGSGQAVKTSRALALEYGFNGNLIIASYLNRALQTANLLTTHIGGQNIQIIPEKDLKEFDFGKLEELTYSEVLKINPKTETEWAKDVKDSFKFPGAKLTFGEFKKGVLKCYKSITESWLNSENQDLIIVTHSIPLRIILLDILEAPSKKWSMIRQENCSINVITYVFQNFYTGESLEKPEIRIETINNTNHLRYDRYRTY